MKKLYKNQRVIKPLAGAMDYSAPMTTLSSEDRPENSDKTHCCAIAIGLLATLCITLFNSQPAQAVGDELQLTLGGGYSALPPIGDGLDGIGAGLEASYQITPLFGLSLGGFFSHHFADTVAPTDEDEPATVYQATDVTTIWFGPRLRICH